MAKRSKVQKQAWCLNCNGGGKAVGQPGTLKHAEADATSHLGAYGHTVVIIDF